MAQGPRPEGLRSARKVLQRTKKPADAVPARPGAVQIDAAPGPPEARSLLIPGDGLAAEQETPLTVDLLECGRLQGMQVMLMRWFCMTCPLRSSVWRSRRIAEGL